VSKGNGQDLYLTFDKIILDPKQRHLLI